jgi:hypothetical protein
MRPEFQALAKAIAGEADQTKSANDDQGVQHGGWSARDGAGFKSHQPRDKSGRQ